MTPEPDEVWDAGNSASAGTSASEPAPHRESTRPEGTRPEGIPDAVRRLLEAGLEKLGDRPDQIRQKLAEMKLPREAYSAILAQLDDRKSGLYRLVAKEVRDLLSNTNFAEDLVRALTTLSFEIKTEVRFIPNDAGSARPSVKSNVRTRRVNDRAEPSDSGERAEDPK